jgi:hypothetical protein
MEIGPLVLDWKQFYYCLKTNYGCEGWSVFTIERKYIEIVHVVNFEKNKF